MPTSSRTLLAVLALLTAAACDGEPTGPVGPPGLSITAGAGAADTVMATPDQPLTVRVIGQDGRPASGVAVRFTALPSTSGAGAQPTMLVAQPGTRTWITIAVDTTDGRGVAAVPVRMGTRAGEGGVAVSVPALSFQDTARFTILPGAADDMSSAPADTVVATGRGFQLRVSVRDRFDNERTAPLTFTAGSGTAAVGASGAVSGVAFGRTFIVVRMGARVDTSWVSVVPAGVIAAYQAAQGTWDTVKLVVTELDGTGYRQVAASTETQYFGSMPASWNPTGTELVYHDGRQATRLFRADLNGGTARVIVPEPPLISEGWPAVSRDGQWIYFGGRAIGNGDGALWRVRYDGTGAEQVGPAVDAFTVDAYPSPSPDGTRLAFVTNREPYNAIRVLDLRDGSIHAIDVQGVTPRWSPDGEWIAYLAGAFPHIGVERGPFGVGPIALMRADGTQRRVLTQELYSGGVTFSPDGRYIVGSAQHGGVHVIDVQTGEAVPLPFSHGLAAPVWKP